MELSENRENAREFVQITETGLLLQMMVLNAAEKTSILQNADYSSVDLALMRGKKRSLRGGRGGQVGRVHFYSLYFHHLELNYSFDLNHYLREEWINTSMMSLETTWALSQMPVQAQKKTARSWTSQRYPVTGKLLLLLPRLLLMHPPSRSYSTRIKNTTRKMSFLLELKRWCKRRTPSQ